MRRVLCTALLVGLTTVGCGGSSDADSSPTPTPSSTQQAETATAAGFRAAVVELWQPLKYADPSKVPASTLAANFDGFAAAVEAEPAPDAEISTRAALASAARAAAEDIRAAGSDPIAYGGAVGTAQGTIGNLIAQLPA